MIGSRALEAPPVASWKRPHPYHYETSPTPNGRAPKQPDSLDTQAPMGNPASGDVSTRDACTLHSARPLTRLPCPLSPPSGPLPCIVATPHNTRCPGVQSDNACTHGPYDRAAVEDRAFRPDRALPLPCDGRRRAFGKSLPHHSGRWYTSKEVPLGIDCLREPAT